MNKIEYIRNLRSEVMAALEELTFLTDKIRDEGVLKDAQLYGEICYKIAQRAFKINERIGKFLDKL